MTPSLHFLSVDDVLTLHHLQIEHFGGQHGVRDRGLIESAVAMPMASFGGADLHPDLFDKASAYLFHLAQNHPFIDGNKRVAAAAGIVFLNANGFELKANQIDYANLVLDVAQGKLQKPEIAQFFRENSQSVS